MNRLAWLYLSTAVLGAWTLTVHAEEVPLPSYLPNTDQAKAWIDADPSVMRVRNAVDAAAHGGAAVAASSHEWTLRLQDQRREYQDTGATSREWQLQLERPLRINGKGDLDRELREVEARIGQARIGEARHESARTLADLWTGVVVATKSKALLEEQLAVARANLDAVSKRQRAGDASALDVSLAQADVGDALRELSLASTYATKVQTALRVRYSAEVPTAAVLPEPNPPIWPSQRWHDRVLDEADNLKVAVGEWNRARVAAARARADLVPDPTFGIFTSSEAMRNERVIGISVSLPLAGAYRSERSMQAQRDADAAQAGVDQVRRDVELEASQAYVEANGALDRWRIAQQTAKLASENARLLQRAYVLGETDLQSLLLSRRQASQAARSALDAQAEAVRWEVRLLIDAHLIWDLERD